MARHFCSSYEDILLILLNLSGTVRMRRPESRLAWREDSIAIAARFS